MTSGNKKQFTLYESWNKGATKSVEQVQKIHQPPAADILEIMDSDDDEDLAMALEQSMLEYNQKHFNNLDAPSTSETYKQPFQPQTELTSLPGNSSNHKSHFDAPSTSKFNSPCLETLPTTSNKETFNLQNNNTNSTNNNQTGDSELPGFDIEAGRTWIYPTNYPIREYQFKIVEKSLYSNTMVVLPTGLGKTFIAAVIMYNFYRWYPGGKIVFMAPTKPLVSQQIEACFKIMGIPQTDTVSMTGSVNPTSRGDHWTRGRVFFLTPQVLSNDLSRGICPARKIRCLIVDEAHKALGNYAYCQVVQELSNYTDQFRIVALSATPGSDIDTVQQVLKNLLISEVELRSEDSPDIQPYTHERAIDKVVVPLGDELNTLINAFIKVMEVYVDRLSRRGAMTYRSPASLSKFIVLKAKEAFCQNPTGQLTKDQFGLVQTDFSMLITLCHSHELLLLHGMRSFYRFLKGVLDGDRGQARTRSELLRNPDFENIFSTLRQKFQNLTFSKSSLNTSRILENPDIVEEVFVYGHPKLQKLEEIVVEHFHKCQSENGDDGYKNTRVMIFSQYRDSVDEIKEMLERRQPLVRVMSFVGQGSTTSKGLTQKMQMKVVQDFKSGGFNTIVSTCVGEEGLDIGEVDLIVCYDAPKSPIRLVQRMGRTGRRRQGRIVVLLTKGKEEQMYNQSLYRKRSIHKAICSNKRFKDLNTCSPRMVPQGMNPVCHKMYMSVGQYDNSKKASKTANITAKGLGKANKKSDILSASELQRWRENLRLPPEEVPVLPKSTFLSLPQVPSALTLRRPEQPKLSLTKWIPWQSGYQGALVSGHSRRTKNFVDVMQLMQLQGNLQSDEDPYGLEMSVYLQRGDILLPGQKDLYMNDDITSYFKARTKNAGSAGVKRKRSSDDDVVRMHGKKSKAGDEEMVKQVDDDDLENVAIVRNIGKKRKATWFDSDDDDFVDEVGPAEEEPDIVILEDDDAHDSHLQDVPVTETVPDDAMETEEMVPLPALFIKPPPADINWDLFSVTKLSIEEIKEIATNNRYVPDSEVVLSPCRSVVFYEANDNVNEQPGCDVMDGMTDSILIAGFDSKFDFTLSGRNEKSKTDTRNTKLLESKPFVQVPSTSDVELVDSKSEQVPSIPKVKLDSNCKHVPSTLKATPTKVPSPVVPANIDDDEFDSDSDILLSGMDADSLMDLEISENEEKSPSAFELSPFKNLVLNPAIPITPPKPCYLLKTQNIVAQKTLSPDMNPKTSTPKSIFPTRTLQKLPENSPIMAKGGAVTFKTPNKPANSPLKRSPNVKPAFKLNDSSVLFDDTSGHLDTRCDVTSFANRPNATVCRAENKAEYSQDLLSVTQMVELLNRTHREQQKLAEIATQVAKLTCTKPKLPESNEDVPMFDFELDFACLDDDFSKDYDNANEKSPRQKPASSKTVFNKSKHGDMQLRTLEQSIRPNSTNVLSRPNFTNVVNRHNSTSAVNRPVDNSTNVVDSFSNSSKCGNANKLEKSNDYVSSFNFIIDYDAFDQPFDEEDVPSTVPKKSSSFRIQPEVFLDSAGSGRKERNENITDCGRGSNSMTNVGRQAESVNSRNSSANSSYGEILRPAAKKRTCVIEDDGSSSSSLWGSPVPVHRETQNREQKGKRKKKRNKPDLIQDEAEISGFASSDDEDTSMDSYDRSFVDDRDVRTQQDVSDQVDMQALYLRSVKSPVGGGARSKFKLQYGAGHRHNVYSQVEREPMESYLEDSFCVNNEQVEYTDSTGPETPDQVSRLKGQKLSKRRILPIITSSEDEDIRSPVKVSRPEISRPGTSGLHTVLPETTASSSNFTLLKTPPHKTAPPLSRFERSCQKLMTSPPGNAHLNQTSAILTKQSPAKPDVLTVFVDTRELSGGQAIISQLRSKHSVQVIAQQLSGSVDYQVGSQTGVLRMTPKALSLVLKKSKVIDKVLNMKDFYDRPFLIVEKEKGAEKNASMFRNRVLDTVLFNLLQTNVTVLYSSNQGETTRILLDLCQSEVTRGNGITPGDCNTPAMQFYTNLPYINTAAALNLSRSFKHVSSFLQSSANEIEQYGRISNNKASKIYNFIRFSFL